MRSWRVLLANLIVALIIVVPPLLGGVALVVLKMPAVTGFLLGLVTAVWVAIALLSLCLTPYVALFENTPILKAPKRSMELMPGSIWFVMKAILVIILVGIASGLISGAIDIEVGGISVVDMLLSFIVSVVANGVFVMLYLHRAGNPGLR